MFYCSMYTLFLSNTFLCLYLAMFTAANNWTTVHQTHSGKIQQQVRFHKKKLQYPVTRNRQHFTVDYYGGSLFWGVNFVVFSNWKKMRSFFNIYIYCFSCAATFKQRHVQTIRRAHEKVVVLCTWWYHKRGRRWLYLSRSDSASPAVSNRTQRPGAGDKHVYFKTYFVLGETNVGAHFCGFSL